MILRRVIGHFRKQEWTAITIDFLIVVFGVFVGLQVNNWNEARQDRRDERFYLARLQEDLVNGERYSSDAYVRFNLVPWAAHSEKVRKLVDGALGLEH